MFIVYKIFILLYNAQTVYCCYFSIDNFHDFTHKLLIYSKKILVLRIKEKEKH